MPLIYIAGVSGTGKSSIMHLLQQRGYEAHGVDEENFADWINKNTGESEAFPAANASLDIHQWYKAHYEVLDTQKIRQLWRDARHKTVFLCGCARGETDVWPFFDLAIALFADIETLKRRVAHRTDSAFGKTPEELAGILHWRAQHGVRYYRRRGAKVVDATKPLAVVADEILELTKQNSPLAKQPEL